MVNTWKDVRDNLNFQNKKKQKSLVWRINNRCPHYIETSRLLYNSNQFTGLYTKWTLIINGLTLVWKGMRGNETESYMTLVLPSQRLPIIYLGDVVWRKFFNWVAPTLSLSFKHIAHNPWRQGISWACIRILLSIFCTLNLSPVSWG